MRISLIFAIIFAVPGLVHATVDPVCEFSREDYLSGLILVREAIADQLRENDMDETGSVTESFVYELEIEVPMAIQQSGFRFKEDTQELYIWCDDPKAPEGEIWFSFCYLSIGSDDQECSWE